MKYFYKRIYTALNPRLRQYDVDWLQKYFDYKKPRKAAGVIVYNHDTCNLNSQMYWHINKAVPKHCLIRINF